METTVTYETDEKVSIVGAALKWRAAQFRE